MITKYSKRSCRDYISLVAFGLVLSFTANLCADSTASSTQPAKKKAPDNSTKSVKVNIISTKVNSTPVKVAGTTTKVNSTPAKATGTTTTVNSTPTDPNSAPAEVKEVVIEEDWKFEWFTDLNKALEIARKRNRSIMLVFGGSDWCVWCQKLDGEVFQKKEFRDYAREHVVSVMLDTPKNMLSSRPHKVFMDKYGVTGYPTVILMDKYGEMLGKGGYLAGGPAPFIEFLAGLIIMPQEKVSSKPLKFDRSPDAVLKALQKQMELRGSKEIISEDNKFIMNVTLGNWRDVKVYLQALPEKDAKKLYYQLLTELKASRQLKTTSSSKTRLKSVLSLGDFFNISDCCPGQLDGTRINSLAAILKIILGSGDYREVTLNTLEKGTPRFGGTDRARRLAAAKLLFEVGMKLDGGKFLPDPDSAMEMKDIDTVKMHINYLAEKARVEKDASAMDQAWELGQWILLDETSSTKERQEAFSLTLSLIPTLEESVASEWLKSRFQNKPLLGMKILATIGDTVVKNVASKDIKMRTRNIALLSRTVGSLLEIAEDDSWDKTLNALAWCWTREAEVSVENYQKPRQNNRYGFVSQRTTSRNKVAYIPVNDVLAYSPDDRWLVRLDRDIKMHVLAQKARLYMKIGEMSDAMDTIKILAVDNPGQCSALFNDYLRIWSVVANNTPPELDERTQRMISLGYYDDMGGIPLTRSRQVRNLEKLSVLFKDIKAMTTEPVSASTAVSVFSECHSKAEVFLKQDIERVFGNIENIPSDQRIQLISVMRSRLADSWRKAETQTAAKTNRSEIQMLEEVSRGYRIIEELIQASRDDDDWQYHRLKAMAMYDSAEYYYSLKDKDIEGESDKYSLAEYTRQRDAALESFKKSAQAYSKIAPNLHSSSRSVLVYLHWFYVTLGASDLAHLKRSTDYNLDYLADIREAIEELPEELADEHMQAFGDSVKSASVQVGPDIKMRFLKASLEITGQHPSSRYAKKLLGYYGELLSELKLSVRIDSDQPGAIVGSERPFGLFVELEHTRNIERESGGFSKYIQSPNSNVYSRQPKTDHREVFRKYITDSLLKNFQVESLVFSEPSVKSRDMARDNWRVTPLAYCLLRVKDKSVDTIPPIQMDMDFADTLGRVVLPLVSDILPIDAKAEPLPSPVSDVAITQVLDDRNIAKGKLKLQIDVTANGIIPPFDDLFEMDIDGITLDGTISDFDRGLAIDKLDTESDRIAAKCQRTWEIDFVIPKDKDIAFRFPVVKDAFAGAKVANKRYDDADIVKAASVVTIKMTEENYMIFIYGLTAAIAMALIVWLLNRKKPRAEIATGRTLPENITPFTLLSFMKRIESENAVKLSSQDYESFREDIVALEKVYFSPSPNVQGSEPDIDQMARKYQALSMNLAKN